MLATAPVTSPEGAAGKLHLMMVFAGHDNTSEADPLNPETFTESNWADAMDLDCGLTLWRGLRRMGGRL